MEVEQISEIPFIKKVSIVCPFYNEEIIIGETSKLMIQKLQTLDIDWELIVVNDGSTDRGPEILKQSIAHEPRAKMIGYQKNQGRGQALKTGITVATGDIIITTEIDLSWGEDIVDKILNAFMVNPSLDAVIASPNIPGGGYKYVPFKRIFVSRLGNKILRVLFSQKITMYTGMTRGYKRDVVQKIITTEKGKEFHVEMLIKLLLLNFQIEEVPVVLEWKKLKSLEKVGVVRKSSSNIPKLISSHLFVGIFANPIRYLWTVSVVCFFAATVFLGFATWRLVFHEGVSVYLALVGLVLAMFGTQFFAFGVLSSQNINILKSQWVKPD